MSFDLNCIETKSKVDQDTLLSIETKQKKTHSHKGKFNNPKKLGILAMVVAISLLLIFSFILLPKLLAPKQNEDSGSTSEVISFSDDTDAIAKAESSVVKLVCYDVFGNEFATGSGFVAYERNIIFTNYHVIDGAYSIKAVTDLDLVYDLDTIVAYDKKHDVAVLKSTTEMELEPLNIGTSKSLNKGEKVVAIGSPIGIKNTVSTGIFSGTVDEDGMNVLQFTAPISSGSSGGALFNDKGEIVGITYASYDVGQNMNLAIPQEVFEAVYEGRKESINVQKYLEEKNPEYSWLKQFKGKRTTIISYEEFIGNVKVLDSNYRYVFVGYVSSIMKEHRIMHLPTEDYEYDSYYLFLTPHNEISNESTFDNERYKNDEIIRISIEESCFNDLSIGDEIICVTIGNSRILGCYNLTKGKHYDFLFSYL